MPQQMIYVPILKGKEGEFAALEALDPIVRSSIFPLIEVPAVPYDFANERPAKSLDEHISGVPERLRRCSSGTSVYLDVPWFAGAELLEDGRTAFELILINSTSIGVNVIPVVTVGSSEMHLAAASRHISENRTGACLRLLVEDFEEDKEIDDEIERILWALGQLDPKQVDLILDLNDIGADAGRATLIARSIFSMLPKNKEWRRMILAAASFPEDLSDVDASTTRVLPRHEWDLWNALQRKPSALPRRDLIFGDYSISHPTPRELDPRTMRMSANIRYTAESQWLIVKGRNVRQYGFSQYFELCRILIKRPEYSGRDFSWGDGYIFDCAAETSGPGNATTWRKVGVNHHVTLVVRQLSSVPRAA